MLHSIDWKFILPLSPWWGGFYERLVRTVKNTFGKILGRSKLNFEELYTILTQVECMLNSRPLSYVYTEKNCEPITPSHLLLGRNLQGHWFRTTTGDENIELKTMKCKKRSKTNMDVKKNKFLAKKLLQKLVDKFQKTPTNNNQ